MNITLLILGVFLILFSTILITINSSSSKDENLNYQIKEKQPNNSLNTVRQKEPTLQEDDEIAPEKYVTNAEDEILFRELIKDETPKIVDLEPKVLNITDEIISLHQEGLSVNQIAARLEKGIREIEIILKVNKLKD